MENTNQKGLSFPQRNWFLLCIFVAILSPLVVHWVQAAAHKEAYKESTEIKPVNSDGAGGATPAAGGAGTASPGTQGGTAADSGKKDTSYKMATPPTDSAKKH